MTFEAWLESKGVSRKAFELRHPNVQAQMINEYNNINVQLTKHHQGAK